MNRLSTATLFFLLCFLLSACIKDQTSLTMAPQLFSGEEYAIIQEKLNIDREVTSFQVELPRHMAITGNPSAVNDAAALMGRVLFYDTQLSATGETSCASCHHQDKAFSDDVSFSLGINGQLTKRNSLALSAVPNFEASYDSPGRDGDIVEFFWDERANSIFAQSLETIENEIEMGRSIADLTADLNTQEMYRILNEKAFQTQNIQDHHILEALQVFCNALASTNSRFDRLMDQEFFGESSNNEPAWTRQEQEGRALYNRDCASCHSFDMSFPGSATANNGLDLVYTDKGKGEIFGSQFNGIFKVPFLRNIELTGPYMHDGRFETLEEVIDHYSENIQSHPNLSPALMNGSTSEPKRFNYSAEEKAAIIQFLKSTTDDVLPNVERFSDPFIR